MKGGRTFRMRIVEGRQVVVEVYVGPGKTQAEAEAAVRHNYAHLRRDRALMRELEHTALDCQTIESVVEVVNRD